MEVKEKEGRVFSCNYASLRAHLSVIHGLPYLLYTHCNIAKGEHPLSKLPQPPDTAVHQVSTSHSTPSPPPPTTPLLLNPAMILTVNLFNSHQSMVICVVYSNSSQLFEWYVIHMLDIQTGNMLLFGTRYAATGVANLATYAIAWVILSSGGDNINPDKLTSADSDHFRVIIL